MPKSDDDRHYRNSRPERSLEPSERVIGKVQVGGNGAGGIWAGPRRISVIGAQTRKITTITVVICIIRSALPLDSCIL